MDAGLVAELLKALVGLGAIGLVIAVVLIAPDRVERIAGWVLKLLSVLPPLRRLGLRGWTRHSVQWRLRRALRTLDETPPWASRRLRVRWLTPAEAAPDAFLASDRVIICLRDDDPGDTNVTNAAAVFVSTSLLPRAKQYLAERQQHALDLFVTTKLLDETGNGPADLWVRESVLPSVRENDELASYLSAFETSHRAGLFFPVALRELEFLGDKVFGRAPVDQIPLEVDAFFESMRRVAARRRREDDQHTFSREYIRMAVVIVGRAEKIDPNGSRWVRYIKNDLVRRDTESIYLLAVKEHATLLDQIAKQIPGFVVATRLTDEARYADGRQFKRRVVLLRSAQTSVFQPRASEEIHLLPGAPLPAGRIRGRIVQAPERPFAFANFDEGFSDVLVPYAQVDGWIDRLLPGDEIEAELELREDARLRARDVRLVTRVEGERQPLRASESDQTSDTDPASHLPPTKWFAGAVVKRGEKYAFVSIPALTQDAFVHFSAFDEWIDDLAVGDRVFMRLERRPEGGLRATAATLSEPPSEGGNTGRVPGPPNADARGVVARESSVTGADSESVARSLVASEQQGPTDNGSAADASHEAHDDQEQPQRLLRDQAGEVSSGAVPQVWVPGEIVRGGSTFGFAHFPELNDDAFVHVGSFTEWVDSLQVGDAIEARLERDSRGKLRATRSRFVRGFDRRTPDVSVVRDIGDPDPTEWLEGTVEKAGTRPFVLARFEGYDELALVHFQTFSDWIESLHVGDRVRAQIERTPEGQLRAVRSQLG